MSEKTTKIVFWVSTGILALMFASSGIMYFAMHEMVIDEFTTLGFPLFIIYPLAIAKVLAAVAITTRKLKVLQYLAYAGIFFDILLAFGAHAFVEIDGVVGDGEQWGTLMPLALCIISFTFARKLDKAQD